LRACCSQLQSLKLYAQLGQQQVALETDGASYYFGRLSHQLLRQPDIGKAAIATEDAPAATSAEEQQAFTQQVAAQTEQLLWLAHKLQLQPLLQHVHRFVQALSHFPESVLRGVLDAVFTARVVEAAGVAGLPGGKQMLVNEALGEVLTFKDSRITGLTEQQQQPLKFEAVLPRPLLGIPSGATVAEIRLALTATVGVVLGLSELQLSRAVIVMLSLEPFSNKLHVVGVCADVLHASSSNTNRHSAARHR
jgi:hypothetical protein